MLASYIDGKNTQDEGNESQLCWPRRKHWHAGGPSFDLAKLGLTEVRHAQAAAVAASWKDRPDLIVLSPYLRTHLTAQPTIERYPDVPVEVVPTEEFTYLEPSRWNGPDHDLARERRLTRTLDAQWLAQASAKER